MRFKIAGKFNRKKPIKIVISEMVSENSKKLIWETQPMKVELHSNNFHFGIIEINTDAFENGMISTKVIEFEIREINPKQHDKSKRIGSCTSKVKNLLYIQEGEKMQKEVLSKSKKLIGTLLFSEGTIQPIFSYLDFKIHRGVNIVPVVAIDYSLSNLTFDNQKWIHSLKQGANNDYLQVIDHITNAYQNICSHFLGFGMGARTIPKKGDTNNCFSLTGNIFDPVIPKENLTECYANTLKKVELSLPVKYHNILEHISDYAKFESENYEARNYFVLIYISAGVIDDFKETIEVLKEISDLPLSVIMVRIRNMQIEDTNDPEILIRECTNSFIHCERTYLEILDYEEFVKSQTKDKFEDLLVKNIPYHVEKYMEIHNVFAHDLDESDYASRVSIALKKQQILEKEGNVFEDDVYRRESLVNIKEFISDIKQSQYTRKFTEDTEENGSRHSEYSDNQEVPSYPKGADDDEDEGENSKSHEEEKVTKNGSFKKDHGGPTEPVTWFKRPRRLTYSEILEERFLATIKDSDDLPKDKWVQIVKEGKLIVDREENLKYLVKVSEEKIAKDITVE